MTYDIKHILFSPRCGLLLEGKWEGEKNDSGLAPWLLIETVLMYNLGTFTAGPWDQGPSP